MGFQGGIMENFEQIFKSRLTEIEYMIKKIDNYMVSMVSRDGKHHISTEKNNLKLFYDKLPCDNNVAIMRQ